MGSDQDIRLIQNAAKSFTVFFTRLNFFYPFSATAICSAKSAWHIEFLNSNSIGVEPNLKSRGYINITVIEINW